MYCTFSGQLQTMKPSKSLTSFATLAASLGIKWLVNQVNKDWDCTKETMDAYCAEVRKLKRHFHWLEFHHVMRDLNVAADILETWIGSSKSTRQSFCPRT